MEGTSLGSGSDVILIGGSDVASNNISTTVEGLSVVAPWDVSRKEVSEFSVVISTLYSIFVVASTSPTVVWDDVRKLGGVVDAPSETCDVISDALVVESEERVDEDDEDV